MRFVSALVFVSPTLALLTAVTAITAVEAATAPDMTDSGILPNTSPVWLADVQGLPNLDPTQEHMFDSDSNSGGGDPVSGNVIYPEQFADVSDDFPLPRAVPDPNHPEVQAVMAQLDWSKVPKAPKRSLKGPGQVDLADNDQDDPYCWWSSSICKTPKAAYLPSDISYCPRLGHWGLNFDDGPFQLNKQDGSDSPEPVLYNLLASHNNQKTTLFYIGSNVIQFPQAAQRALADGHTICSHTWSHQLMTTLTNEEIVAELYWTQKAIKTVLGITPKCWRPAFGDVDDRVRAIAWQMGMRTFLWDQDTFDWGLQSGTVDDALIDDTFKKWIHQSRDGTNGHITLQHESSPDTINVAERWLSTIQNHFSVMTIHQCINEPHPYWENNWVYATLDQPNPASDAAIRIHAVSVNDTQTKAHQDASNSTGKTASSAAGSFSPPCILLLFIIMFNVATSTTFYWRH